LKVLFIGDVVGSPGRKIIKQILPEIKKENSIDFCIANGENAAGGKGITYVVAQELYSSGIDALTMGNHVWSKSEVLTFIDEDNKIVRPANYPEELPGKGSTIISNGSASIGILNIMGRIFMEGIDSPFKSAEKEIKELKKSTKVIIVDMHAEASSEKCAVAWHLDGKVSCVLGTHTHVQTSDERILPFGTAFITDVGMTGPHDGIIGVDKDIILNRFLTHMPIRHELAKGRIQFNSVILEIDEKNGKTIKIERFNQIIK
jgi:hypothetical protein